MGATDRRSDGQQRAGLVAESRATGADRVAHALGDVRTGRVGVVAQELLREQCVAAAAVERPTRPGPGSASSPSQARARAETSSCARPPSATSSTAPSRRSVRERAANVVDRPAARGAGGRDDEELGGPWRAKQRAQCQERALVGPLQVVDDQQHRLGKRAHERVERVEDPRADPGVRLPVAPARPRSRSSSGPPPPTRSSTAPSASSSGRGSRRAVRRR